MAIQWPRNIYLCQMVDKEVGTWENNKLNGYAITYFANGTIDKQGIFKDDEFLYAKLRLYLIVHHQDIFIIVLVFIMGRNGDKYVGEWQNDKSHGQGTYTHGPWEINT